MPEPLDVVAYAVDVEDFPVVAHAHVGIFLVLQLSGEVNVVVEGIAASAASVIMCAGDTVTVYPGSLVMIHGVSVYLWDSLNIQDMKQLMKGMDASPSGVM